MMQTNIDPIRAEIMRLEEAKVFDQRAWAKVLIALTDRPNARADAARRMETAKANSVGGVDWAVGKDYTVAVETDVSTDEQRREGIYCGVCSDWIKRDELRRWTGDDALHYLCPGCGSDLLPVRYPEKEYDDWRYKTDVESSYAANYATD